MKPVSGKRFCKALERRGWILLRINGEGPISSRGSQEGLGVACGWPGGVDGLQIAPGTRLDVYQALSTRNGGEVLSADAY